MLLCVVFPNDMYSASVVGEPDTNHRRTASLRRNAVENGQARAAFSQQNYYLEFIKFMDLLNSST